MNEREHLLKKESILGLTKTSCIIPALDETGNIPSPELKFQSILPSLSKRGKDGLKTGISTKIPRDEVTIQC